MKRNLNNLVRRNLKNTLETSGEDEELHSKRVGKMENTLETSEEDQELHSKRVGKMKNTLETSGEGAPGNIHVIASLLLSLWIYLEIF